LSGHCVAECTGVGLAQGGIKVFGSQLHTHLTGRRVVTRHARDGQELPLLNYDNHYSTHFQEIRLLPRAVTVLPVISYQSPTTACSPLRQSSLMMSVGSLLIAHCSHCSLVYRQMRLLLCAPHHFFTFIFIF
jgi:hypothetical protein